MLLSFLVGGPLTILFLQLVDEALEQRYLVLDVGLDKSASQLQLTGLGHVSQTAWVAASEEAVEVGARQGENSGLLGADSCGVV